MTAALSGVEESPDTAGQDAPELLIFNDKGGGESRRKVAQKTDRRLRISGVAAGKGETVG